MANLTMVREHGGTSLEEGKESARKVLDAMKPTLSKYVDRTDWNKDGTEAKVQGRHIKGSLRVDETHLRIDLKLSMVASLVKGKIESRIDEALKEHS